jgi:geranylgeranyl reductase
MKTYDVIIAGAGPAGLRCAQVLSESELSVLLLEKETGPVYKVCAGGLTRKDLAILDVPEDVLEHRITSTAICSRLNRSHTEAKSAFIFTVDRKEFSEYQHRLLANSRVEVRFDAALTEVSEGHVTVNGTEQVGYRFLVGAEGYNSKVRKHLGLPVEKRLIGLQYHVPIDHQPVRLEIHLHSKYFRSWYGWVFPHRNTVAYGCCADPKKMSAARLSAYFHRWLKEQKVDLAGARYESAPVSYDYRGMRFGNLFLVGDAGGFASGLTGEGIYQALVSGEAAARTIIDPDHRSEALEGVIRYNDIQRKIMNLFHYAGPFRNLFHELLIALMNLPMVKSYIHRSFS